MRKLIMTAALSALFGISAVAQPETRLLRFPAISNDQVVFTYGGDLFTVPASGGVQTLVQLVRDLGDAGIQLDDVGLRRPTLDDVFLTLTGSPTTPTIII